jgi:hypothetical protein
VWRAASVVIAVIAVKAIFLWLDPTIRVYLGDSAAYLWGAIDGGRLPEDRSFTYSLIIRAVAGPYESLMPLIRWQSLAGVVTAVILYLTLARRFDVRHGVAVVAACVLAVEPAQLYYERMVLAETFGLVAFAAFFATACAYLASRRAIWLPTAALCGLAAVTLRLNYLPVVLVISLVLPLLPLLDRSTASRMVTVKHFALSTLCVVAFHAAYTVRVGALFGVSPTYLPRSGFLRLGLVLPLVRPEHFARVGLPSDLETELGYAIADPHARMPHLWAPGGLVRALRARGLDVERVANELSRMAVVDNPFGLVRLGIYTLGDYFRPEEIQTALENDLGRRAIPPDALWNLREHWGYDATDLHARATVVSRYFEAGTVWLVACLVLAIPLGLLNLAVSWSTPQRSYALLVCLFGVGLVLAHVLFVPVAFYRYLHPLPFFVLAAAVPVVTTLRSRRTELSP